MWSALFSRLRARPGFAAALVVGAALRLHHLGRESVWLDEAFAIDLGRSPVARILSETAKDVHPPLYYLLLKVWMIAAGPSETGARLLSVLASLGAVALLYALASRLFGSRTATWAAWLAAVTPFQIAFAQEARMYALLSLLGLASIAACLDVLQTGRARSMAAATVLTALMLYTHAYAVFVLLANLLVLLCVVMTNPAWAKRYVTRTVFALLGAVVLFLPWLPIQLRQIVQVRSGFWIPDPSARGLSDALSMYAGSAPLAWICGGLAVGGLVAVAWRRVHELRMSPAVALPVAGAWLTCPLVVPLMISKVSTPIFLPKYTIVASLAFLMLAARGLAAIPSRLARWGCVALVLAALIQPVREFYDAPRKEDWRGSVAALERAARPGDVVFFNPSYAEIPFDYYSRRGDLTRVPFLKDHDVLTSRCLKDLVDYDSRGHARVWVVLSNPDDLSPLLLTELGRDRVMASHASGPGLDVYRFDLRSAAPMAPRPQ